MATFDIQERANVTSAQAFLAEIFTLRESISNNKLCNKLWYRITHRAVYPDLDGVAKSLWETEVL